MDSSSMGHHRIAYVYLIRLTLALMLLVGTGLSASASGPADVRDGADMPVPESVPPLKAITLADYDCASQSEIPEDECAALSALYTATNGDGWWVKMGWLEGDPSTWYGITVEGGHVTRVELPVNNLTGALPSELGNLSELTALELDSNNLSGSIPVALGNLTDLTSLNLAFNSLTGGIPAELGNLTLLEDLHLANNQLSGSIPVELGNMASLSNLVLERNNLTGGISSSLTGLSNLFYIDLSENALTGGIPSQLWANPSLAWVVLDDNQLTGSIPPGLGSLSGLVNVNLGSNSLTGNIPADLANATTLLDLNLSDNGLTGGIPEGLGVLNLLTTLDLSGNPLGGAIPTALSGLSSLERLDLSSAALTGGIPEGIGGLLYLTHVDLSGNQLTGAIPQSLGSLVRVETLDLSDNRLEDVIPGALGSMVSLQSLNLSSNLLTGNIPSLGGLAALRTLDLSQNGMSGEPPSMWGGMVSLETLRLNDNDFFGPIPASLSAATELEALALGSNEFSGDIPAALGDLTSLSELDLGGNHLTGVIPSQIGSLTHLQSLSLRSNLLEGPIPQSVTMLTGLTSADLAYNMLHTTDTGVDAFLALKDPDWSQTQTVPPTNVRVLDVTNSSLSLGWTPIAYTGDYGHYEVLVSATSGGPYTPAEVTPSKLAAGVILAGLEANTTYYMVARTHTPAHDDQDDALASAYSGEIAGTTSIPVGFDCENVTEVPCEECEALEALYTATDGANWQRNDGWLQTTQLSAWDGVTVSEGHVIGLALSGNNLTGALPPDLGDLAGLQALYLDQNALTGVIPAELGALNALQVMNLSTNSLDGAIPDALGGMAALETLQLKQNLLAGEIPSALGSLSTLTTLDVSENQLSGEIPTELGNLASLQRLMLHANSLTGSVPGEMGNLTSLMALSVSHNALSGELPASLTNLTSLGSEWWAAVNFGYNRFSATDAGLLAFLAEKDPDWAATQTVAPTDLAIDYAYSGSIRLSWTPIEYTGDDGWYQVSFATQADGPWTVHGATLSKAADTYLADGLDPATWYWFQVRTTTHPHDLQSNELWSEATDSVMASTTTPALEGFGTPTAWILLYGPEAGGWFEQNIFPRMLADVDGDGREDIVAFGNKASYVSLSSGTSFGGPQPWLFGLGVTAGGWVEQNIFPRTTGDVNGDGLADLVAFGNRAVYVSLSDGASFGEIEPWITAYGVAAGGWTEQNIMPRHVGDVNGDGLDDIVGFGNSATYVSLSTGDIFEPPEPWIYAYGVNAGGWTDQNTFPRMLGDVNGDGMQDIVAFGDTATYVSLSTGDAFGAVTPWIFNFGVTAGGWHEQNIFPRMLGDVNGDGRDDIIGCGDAATYVSLSTGAGFSAPMPAVLNYGVTAGGWGDQNTFPRVSGDANGDGLDDLAGFGNRATYVSLADW